MLCFGGKSGQDVCVCGTPGGESTSLARSYICHMTRIHSSSSSDDDDSRTQKMKVEAIISFREREMLCSLPIFRFLNVARAPLYLPACRLPAFLLCVEVPLVLI